VTVLPRVVPQIGRREIAQLDIGAMALPHCRIDRDPAQIVVIQDTLQPAINRIADDCEILHTNVDARVATGCQDVKVRLLNRKCRRTKRSLSTSRHARTQRCGFGQNHRDTLITLAQDKFSRWRWPCSKSEPIAKPSLESVPAEIGE